MAKLWNNALGDVVRETREIRTLRAPEVSIQVITGDAKKKVVTLKSFNGLGWRGRRGSKPATPPT